MSPSATLTPELIAKHVQLHLAALNKQADDLVPAPSTTIPTRLSYAQRLLDRVATTQSNDSTYIVLMAFLTIVLKQLPSAKLNTVQSMAYHKLRDRAIKALDETESLKATITEELTKKLMAESSTAVAASSSSSSTSSASTAASARISDPPSSQLSQQSQPARPNGSVVSNGTATHGATGYRAPPTRSTSYSAMDAATDDTVKALDAAMQLSYSSSDPSSPTTLRTPTAGSSIIRRPINTNNPTSPTNQDNAAISYFRSTQDKLAATRSSPNPAAARLRPLQSMSVDPSKRSKRVMSIMDATYWDPDEMQSTYERQDLRTDVYGNALGGSGYRPPLPTAPAPINTSFPTLTQPVPVTRPFGASHGPPRSSSLNSTTSSPIATVPPTLPPRLHKPQPAPPASSSSAILGSTLARGRPRLATPTSASPLMSAGGAGAGSMLLSPRIAAAANARASILSTTQFDYRFHDSEATMSEVVGAGVAGIKNMGNSCYQNSVLQCLFGAVPLIRYFSSGDFKSHINPSNPLGSKGAVAKAYFSLVHDWKRNAGASVAPVAFRDMLADHAAHFATREQHDSQEFLTYLLDALHEDLKHPPPAGTPLPPDDNDDLLSIGDVATAASIAWQRYLVRNSSFVSQWFMGQLRSSIECLTCHAQSVTYAPFTSLSVPVVGDQVTDGLGELLRPEILDGEDAWKCPRCKVPRRAEKRLVVARVPPVLILHIKRFEYVGPFRNKIDKVVKFPLRGLDLRGVVPSGGQGVGQAAVFDLFAVSNHYGGLDGGHYTAIVKHGGGWHYFDDSRVSKCGEDKVVTNAAYTLFYRQREGGEAAGMGNKL